MESSERDSQDSTGVIWTIGHSNMSIERFLELLRAHEIELLVDVRTAPYSRHWPQFSRDALARSVEADGITYLFLGRELGGKPDDPALRWPHGLPDYDAIAATPLYQEGIKRLTDLACKRRTAFMCSEGDPAQCHRERLVARTLRAEGWQVRHILTDGSIQQEAQASLW
ncbi:MAG TPA: DUF488 domain-containing protein [Ktedonobacterales bacterium]